MTTDPRDVAIVEAEMPCSRLCRGAYHRPNCAAFYRGHVRNICRTVRAEAESRARREVLDVAITEAALVAHRLEAESAHGAGRVHAALVRLRDAALSRDATPPTMEPDETCPTCGTFVGSNEDCNTMTTGGTPIHWDGKQFVYGKRPPTPPTTKPDEQAECRGGCGCLDEGEPATTTAEALCDGTAVMPNTDLCPGCPACQPHADFDTSPPCHRADEGGCTQVDCGHHDHALDSRRCGEVCCWCPDDGDDSDCENPVALVCPNKPQPPADKPKPQPLDIERLIRETTESVNARAAREGGGAEFSTMHERIHGKPPADKPKCGTCGGRGWTAIDKTCVTDPAGCGAEHRRLCPDCAPAQPPDTEAADRERAKEFERARHHMRGADEFVTMLEFDFRCVREDERKRMEPTNCGHGRANPAFCPHCNGLNAAAARGDLPTNEVTITYTSCGKCEPLQRKLSRLRRAHRELQRAHVETLHAWEQANLERTGLRATLSMRDATIESLRVNQRVLSAVAYDSQAECAALRAENEKLKAAARKVTGRLDHGIDHGLYDWTHDNACGPCTLFDTSAVCGYLCDRHELAALALAPAEPKPHEDRSAT